MNSRLASAAIVIFVGGLLGCAEEDEPLSAWLAAHASPDAGPVIADSGNDAVQPACRQSHAEALPQRLVTSAASDGGAPVLIYSSDLFDRFTAICGSCHGPSADPPGLGGFRLATSSDFEQGMNASVLAHVTSDGPSDPANPQNPVDPNDPMPPFSSPSGEPYSDRSPTDPVREFADLVQAWFDAGSPSVFQAPTPQDDASGSDGGTYRLAPSVANAMTNIGNCVPNEALVATAASLKRAADLDTMFQGLQREQPGPGVTPAQLIGLPEHLSQTDLVSLDSSELAGYGVVAYQPAYPLWSDNAGKLRHVRVPLGASIHFDAASQEFTIPDNTRFYKTFLKAIYDTDGSRRWRKIETRLIVVRQDTQNPDGTRK